MMFKRMQLKTRLYLTLGGLIFLVFIIGEWSLWQSAQINKRVDNIYTQEVIPLENISHLKGALYRIRDRSLRLIDTTDSVEIAHHKQIIESQIKRINEELDKYDNTRLSKEEQIELEKFTTNFQEYLSIIKNKIYPNLLKKSEKELEPILYKEAIFEFRQAREALNELSEYQIQRAKLRHKHSDEIFNKQIIIIQLIIIAIVGLSGFFAKMLMSSIIEPIKQINEVLTKISHEDFSKRIRITSEDELGKMSQMLNNSISMLQTTFYELSTLVNYDKLTNLPNRKMFQEKIEKCINRCQKSEELFSVMFIDVDNFKNVNDTYGHTAGDKLLEIIAKRMKTHIRSGDTLARLGGDEFAILLQNLKNPTVPGNIANKILDAMQKPIYIDQHTIFTSISIGIYISDHQNESREKILSYADVAMYAAKNSGKAKYIYFNKKMHEKLESETLLESRLRDAVKNREFKIYFQPIIEPKTEALYGVETLLRWERDGQVVSPAKFIAKLESNGMILDVTYTVIEEVFEMIERREFKNIVSINLSILQFYDENFLPFLKRLLQKYPSINPQKIYFEITESVFAQNNDLIFSTMELVKKLGFKFSLDDFGTGYSSLSYIKDYPINTIKIDKKFVDNLLDDVKAQELLEGIVYLAKTLHLTIIVEGVEDAATLSTVTKHNSVKIQGYYFYKPMPQEEFERLLD
ncbi:EAL domain-containing protein [Sulfurimonas sp. NWX79]|uniref:EAL domain-containing protein n=1 Tax=Sulfurimonas sp. NWX79 TaxID=2925412 RepID=UPI003204DC6E